MRGSTLKITGFLSQPMPKSQSRCVFYRKTMLEYILLIKRYSWCAYIFMVKSKHYWYQDKYIHCNFTQKSMPYIDYIYNLIILQPCLCHFGQYKLSPQQISCVQYVQWWRMRQMGQVRAQQRSSFDYYLLLAQPRYQLIKKYCNDPP